MEWLAGYWWSHWCGSGGPATFRLWPVFAVLGFVLIEVRSFVVTPYLPAALQATPSKATVAYIDDRTAGLIFGSARAGLRGGVLCRPRAAARLPMGASLAADLAVVGAGSMVGASLVGWAMAAILAGAAAEGRAPSTVAAVFSVGESFSTPSSPFPSNSQRLGCGCVSPCRSVS